jgi:hypothetical protein
MFAEQSEIIFIRQQFKWACDTEKYSIQSDVFEKIQHYKAT